LGVSAVGLYQSTDAGNDWRLTQSSGLLAAVSAFAQDSENFYAGADGYEESGVYQSSDGGTVWTDFSAGLPQHVPINFIAADPISPGVLYAGTWGRGVYVSGMEERYLLDLQVVGGGGGRIRGTVNSDIRCTGTCRKTLPKTGSPSLRLTAKAAKGSRFTGWGGDCSGKRTCKLTVDGDKQVAARFEAYPPTVQLTVDYSGSGSGNVTASPRPSPLVLPNCNGLCGGYPLVNPHKPKRVKLTARPATGSVFAGWSGACSGTRKTCVLTMGSERSATALFEVK
jgi:hypothetical protein